MNRADVVNANRLVANIDSLETFSALDKDDGRPVFMSVAKSARDANQVGLRLTQEEADVILRIMTASLRVRLEDMGVQ